jgi:GAF domain-containing protein
MLQHDNIRRLVETVVSGGTRYGSLCVIDTVPRSFTAELYRLLINFAELAVQELENDTVIRLPRTTVDIPIVLVFVFVYVGGL